MILKNPVCPGTLSYPTCTELQNSYEKIVVIRVCPARVLFMNLELLRPTESASSKPTDGGHEYSYLAGRNTELY